MNFAESIRVALEGIWTNRLRSFLTMLGIIIGVAAVIAVVAIGQGSRSVILQEIEKIGSNLFVVYVPWNSEKPRSADDLTLQDVEMITELASQVRYLAPSSFSQGETAGPKGKKTAQVQGTTGDYAFIRNIELRRGRFFTNEDSKAGRPVAVIDEKLAEDLFGRREPLGERILVSGSPVMVIGVAKRDESLLMMDNETRTVYLPISVWQRVFRSRWIGQLEGQAVSRDKVDQAVDQVISILERRHQKKDFYKGVTLESEMQMADKIMGILTLVIGSIAGISLSVGGIGVMNIMLVSVTERTREIGIRKALGARRKDILYQFLIEAVTICLVGGAIGLILGIGLALVIALVAKWPPVLSWWPIILAIVFSSAVGIFFGLYPASKAARLDPIEALRYE
ncbi:MAG TPA: FtsX-like permease family protein [Clostridia bacterium]|nr:FtsX-like permease family protein [Clostridia bacterium]